MALLYTASNISLKKNKLEWIFVSSTEGPIVGHITWKSSTGKTIQLQHWLPIKGEEVDVTNNNNYFLTEGRLIKPCPGCSLSSNFSTVDTESTVNCIINFSSSRIITAIPKPKPDLDGIKRIGYSFHDIIKSNIWTNNAPPDYTGQSHVSTVIANQPNWSYIKTNVTNTILERNLQDIAKQLEMVNLDNARLYTDGSLFTNHTTQTGQVVMGSGWVLDSPDLPSQIKF